jgi:hypothetical protein
MSSYPNVSSIGTTDGFRGVIGESWDIFKGMGISTIGIMCGLSFNNFLDGVIQLVIPVQEKDLSTASEITTYRFLLTLFLLCLLIAFTIILALKPLPPKGKANPTTDCKTSTSIPGCSPQAMTKRVRTRARARSHRSLRTASLTKQSRTRPLRVEPSTAREYWSDRMFS